MKNSACANLSVHRNTAAKRQRHKVTKQFMDCAREQASKKDVEGYVIMTWDKDFRWSATWNSGPKMPGIAMPDFVRNALLIRMGHILPDPHDGE